MSTKDDAEFKARALRLVRDHVDDYGSVTAAGVSVGTQLGVTRECLVPGLMEARASSSPIMRSLLVAEAWAHGGSHRPRRRRPEVVRR